MLEINIGPYRHLEFTIEVKKVRGRDVPGTSQGMAGRPVG